VLLRHVKVFHGQDNAANEGRNNQRIAVENSRNSLRGGQYPSNSSPGDESEIDVDDNKDDTSPAQETMPVHSLHLEDPPAAAGQMGTTDLDGLVAASMLQARKEGLNGSVNAALRPLLQVTHPNHPHTAPEPTATQDFVAPDLTTAPRNITSSNTGFRPHEPLFTTGGNLVPASFIIGKRISPPICGPELDAPQQLT